MDHENRAEDIQPNDDELLKPAVDIEIKGAGFAIERLGLRLNAEGDTHYRIQEGVEEVIDRFSFDAFVIKRKLEFSIHTWLSTGKHLDLAQAKEIQLGETFEQDIKVEKDGSEIELKISLRFYEVK